MEYQPIQAISGLTGNFAYDGSQGVGATSGGVENPGRGDRRRH